MGLTWVNVLFGVGGVSMVKVLWDVIKYFITRRDSQVAKLDKFSVKQKNIERLLNSVINDSVQIQNLLSTFVDTTEIDRISVVKFENGGGVPQLGTKQHITILYEAIDKKAEGLYNLKPLKPDFDRYEIDASHQQILLDVINKGSSIQITESMPEGEVKNLLMSYGITKNIVVPIIHIPQLEGTTSGFFLYLSMNQFNRIDTDSLDGKILILKNKISKIFKSFYVRRVV